MSNESMIIKSLLKGLDDHSLDAPSRDYIQTRICDLCERIGCELEKQAQSDNYDYYRIKIGSVRKVLIKLGLDKERRLP